MSNSYKWFTSVLRMARNQKALIAGILCFSVLLFVVGSGHARATDKRLVRLSVDGVTKIYPTKQESLAGFLDEQSLQLREKDKIEPSVDTEITGSVFNANVYRARPVLVEDEGTKKATITTAAQSPHQIAEEAGLKINDADKLSMSRINDIFAEGVLGLKLEVDRANQYELVLFGKTEQIFSHQTNVGQILSENGVELQEGDTITPSESANLKPGQKIAISTVRTEKVTETEAISFDTREISDETMDIGQRKTQTKGENGSADVVYEITKTNGEVTQKKEVQRVVTKEPVQQVDIVGSKPQEPVAPAYSGGGTKEQWMAAAGIPQSEWTYVDFIVSRESGWNPSAVNPSSGACGLGQQLPCGKWAGAWNDPVAALQGQYGYVQARYGSYAGAYAFWSSNHWY